MSGLFSSVVNLGKGVIQRIQAGQQDRHGCLLFVGPRQGGPKGLDAIFEIIAHSEKGNYSFSLRRFTDVDEARTTFCLWKERIPALLEIDPDLCTQASLQAICGALRDHPSYTIMHLCVVLDFRLAVAHGETVKFLNTSDQDGRTPLMLAVQKESSFMITFLVGKGALTNCVDSKKNSVYHYAAMTNKEIVTQVSDNPNQLLNECNEEGDTPLHIACKKDKPDCVQALLCAGADVNVAGTLDGEYPIYSALKTSSTRCVKEIIQMYPKQLHVQDMKHGGTPLHWAKSRDLIEALVESGCVVSARNFESDTALHIMTRYDRLDCVLALVTHEADIDAKDKNGNTPLHIAIDAGFTLLVKALLAFDADPTLVNNDGHTPWSLAQLRVKETSLMDFKDREGVLFALYAVGAGGPGAVTPNGKNGAQLDFKKLRAGLSPKHQRVRTLFDDVLMTRAKCIRSKKGHPGGRLLSLDGGGIKGLVLTRLLLSMEKVWQAPVTHCFDWIAGTSTGGILALALASGKTVFECQVLYMKLKNKVFVGSKPYSSKPLEELLQKEFGLETRLYDIKEPKLVVTATLADRTPPDTYLFRNYKSPQELLGIKDYEHPELGPSAAPTLINPSEQLIWKAAKASGAAPSFFSPEGNFVDGGILTNNPSVRLLTEITEYNVAQRALDRSDAVVEPQVMVSLGTGTPPVRKTKVVDIFRPSSFSDTAKLVMNYDGMGKLMLDSILDADQRVVDECRAFCLAMQTSYYRFSPQLHQDLQLDETEDRPLVELLWYTMAYAHQKREDIAALKDLLVC